LKQEEEGFS